ncbi:endonuclease III [Holzapfeliella sp. He02]|uniref:Endonuclease III n=1 Tax=Holzapfeliella saturejae TaxID=3082953 RepID=A0ABU8SHR8_9LACO
MAYLSQKEAKVVLNKILAKYPNQKASLDYHNPFEFLIAVMLSAQTTDKAVNKVAPDLFSILKTPADIKSLTVTDIKNKIKRLGLYRNKAKNIYKLSYMLLEQFNGEVPKTKKDLLKLPGIGIKTANVFLAEIYQVPAIAVDTHVERIAKQFKMVPKKATPLQVEAYLEKIVPQKDWIAMHLALITFGRNDLPAKYKDLDPYQFLT